MTTRIMVSQNSAECQLLRVPSTKRVIVSSSRDFQLLFNMNSTVKPPVLVVKMGAIFNSIDLNSIRVAGYLYESTTGTVSNASSCQFTISKVVHPTWSDVPLLTSNGIQLTNSYYYSDIPISSLGADFLGETTLMIECLITRLNKTYRDRIYVNHLGIYNNCFNLFQTTEYLDLIKKDE